MDDLLLMVIITGAFCAFGLVLQALEQLAGLARDIADAVALWRHRRRWVRRAFINLTGRNPYA